MRFSYNLSGFSISTSRHSLISTKEYSYRSRLLVSRLVLDLCSRPFYFLVSRQSTVDLTCGSAGSCGVIESTTVANLPTVSFLLYSVANSGKNVSLNLVTKAPKLKQNPLYLKIKII